ncbi:MAG: iron ABC transporter permease [Alphaproteobacteria bacterium]|nr:iron ABC transporter permease [Alphaproteobacteria bacterium]MCW5739215.1 iron ABC transporter permease [Alphaproteobacteria bacterium]
MAGFLLLPWYAQQEGILALDWISGTWSHADSASGLALIATHGSWWLAPLLPILLACLGVGFIGGERRQRGTLLVLLAGLGLAVFWLQALSIGLRGWNAEWLTLALGTIDGRQVGIGGGATLVMIALLGLLSLGLAQRGAFGGDSFVAGAMVGLVACIVLFTAWPVLRILLQAFNATDGAFAPALLVERLTTAKIWSLRCLSGGGRCGVAWNTLFLALACGAGTTLLGLAFALIVTRTGFRMKRTLRVLTVLPIITPPFVIGLGLILVFGRAGIVNQALEAWFDVAPTRWIYGFQGVFLAQLFAFTPVAFLVLIGVVEGVSPTLEEASQTLRANRWDTFRTVSLPLMKPGLANAFLVGFIESIADFGNPIVLGGDYGVLSTEIYFAVVGAQLDYGRAASLALLLLAFALGAFFLQRRLVGTRSYATIAGKGDAGLPVPMPDGLRRLAQWIALPWAGFTALLYGFVLAGGFVKIWGRDHTLTLQHYAKAFSVESGPAGLIWTGAAWGSFWTTVKLAAIAAPLTALLGLLAAWLLVRQRFIGRSTLEFATMLSFAVPGTVIGVAYVFTFNVPPLEITGTALILVLCFVFRNMPVGVRAGMAAMSQIDRSLDEASATLRGRAWQTLAHVVLPLMRPAMVAALVYGFVRAVTTVSAVVFLVTAEYELATTFIVLRVINGDYGLAIAYSCALILLMLAAILLIQLLVGQRRLGRRAAPAPLAARAGA